MILYNYIMRVITNSETELGCPIIHIEPLKLSYFKLFLYAILLLLVSFVFGKFISVKIGIGVFLLLVVGLIYLYADNSRYFVTLFFTVLPEN
jgi:uncharacterized membrane protein